jgi:hypothetical protein
MDTRKAAFDPSVVRGVFLLRLSPENCIDDVVLLYPFR